MKIKDNKIMINGLLIYNSYDDRFNIGDYIQSLAAQQFFSNEIHNYINREELNNYYGEKIKLIMNGWFMHEPNNWPPTRDIYPFFVSFHINSLAAELLLKPESLKYLKKWEPIGCRDKKTVELLEQKGIKAYFSSCLTLTLGLDYSSKGIRNGIYFVDPYFEVCRDLRSIIKYGYHLILNFKKIKIISDKLYKQFNIKSIIKSVAFYSDYQKVFDSSIIEEMIFVKHIVKESDFDSEKGRFEYAKELLRCYSKAKLVVTSRIHCALPSIGMNTPVIYVENTEQKETSFCRLEGIKELFNIITYKKGAMEIIFDNLKKIYLNTSVLNKKDFIKYKDLLITQCREFVKYSN